MAAVSVLTVSEAASRLLHLPLISPNLQPRTIRTGEQPTHRRRIPRHHSISSSQPLTHVVQAMASLASQPNGGGDRPNRTRVKICGVTSVKDAELAAAAGADLIGMIMWPKSKRGISLEVAQDVAAAAIEAGAQPVAVFVDESADVIARTCEATGAYAQLHGDGARSQRLLLPKSLKVVYVMHAEADGTLRGSAPASSPEEQDGPVDWLLIDGVTGGSGEAFAWDRLQVPTAAASRGWLLAGGLHPGNVDEAIRVLRPTAVDVASGVAGPGGVVKDPEKVYAFIKAVRDADIALAQAAAQVV